jgi:DNA repair exonuclease SbcCD ATPase subunit
VEELNIFSEGALSDVVDESTLSNVLSLARVGAAVRAVVDNNYIHKTTDGIQIPETKDSIKDFYALLAEFRVKIFESRSTSTELEEMKVGVERAEEARAKLQIAIDEKMEELANLRTRNELLVTQVDDATQKIDSLEVELAAAHTAKDDASAKTALHDAIKVECKRVKAELEANTTEVERLKHERDVAQVERKIHDAVAEERDKLKREIEEIRAETADTLTAKQIGRLRRYHALVTATGKALEKCPPSVKAAYLAAIKRG